MEAAVKEKVRKIVGEAIKLNYDVEYLYTVEDFNDLYIQELSKISDVASDLQHRLKTILGYVEAEDMTNKLIESGEIIEYWKNPA